MKKFYYNKESSQDESLVISPLEHRNTMDVNQEHRQGMSARAASVNSLDLLSEAPSIPRVKTRDMARSMSDAAAKDNPKKQKLVTETELSSSWLYQNMRDSINARFKSPRKSPSVHKSEIEQSILKDPELKPIEKRSKAAKTSLCICHFATMIAVCLCTIGLLVSIGMIIYIEIFAGRNITFLHTDEADVDLADVVLDSFEVYNLTTHKPDDGEVHILNEALTHRLDGDEEILNEVLKASTTNDIISAVLNKNKDNGQSGDYVTDQNLELKHHINVKNSKIKFQDDVTVIYEMKPKASAEDEADSDNINSFKGRSFGIDLNQSDENSSERNSGISSENTDRDGLKIESKINRESEEVNLNDSVPLEDVTAWNVALEDESEETVSEDKLGTKGFLGNMQLEIFEKKKSIEPSSSESFIASEEISQDFEFEKGPNPVTDHLFKGDDITDLSKKLEKYNGSEAQMPTDSDALLTNFSKSDAVEQSEGEISQSVLEVVDDHTVEDEHDVNTMLITVDDDTEVSTDSFISKKSGEIEVFQVSSPTPTIEPIKQTNVNSVISSKKPVDIKVSLAEAMKHLQNLDANGKVLAARTKANVQKPKRKTVSKKDDEERKRYLQRMRLMFHKQLQK